MTGWHSIRLKKWTAAGEESQDQMISEIQLFSVQADQI